MTSAMLEKKIIEGIPEVDSQYLFSKLPQIEGQVKLIDVRRSEEFSGELGHIEGSKLITLGPDLVEFLKTEKKDQEIVFICRSGARSGSATFESIRLGFTKTANMTGGMLAWNALKLPTLKI